METLTTFRSMRHFIRGKVRKNDTFNRKLLDFFPLFGRSNLFSFYCNHRREMVNEFVGLGPYLFKELKGHSWATLEFSSHMSVCRYFKTSYSRQVGSCTPKAENVGWYSRWIGIVRTWTRTYILHTRYHVRGRFMVSQLEGSLFWKLRLLLLASRATLCYYY